MPRCMYSASLVSECLSLFAPVNTINKSLWDSCVAQIVTGDRKIEEGTDKLKLGIKGSDR